jgi:hypothetical protein
LPTKEQVVARCRRGNYTKDTARWTEGRKLVGRFTPVDRRRVEAHAARQLETGGESAKVLAPDRQEGRNEGNLEREAKGHGRL